MCFSSTTKSMTRTRASYQPCTSNHLTAHTHIALASQTTAQLLFSRLSPILLHRYLDFLWNQYSNTTYDPTSNPWTYMRTEDMQTSIMWLYDNYPQDRQQFLLDLNELLYNKSFDWDDYYRHHLPTTNVTGWNMNDHGSTATHMTSLHVTYSPAAHLPLIRLWLCDRCEQWPGAEVGSSAVSRQPQLV